MNPWLAYFLGFITPPLVIAIVYMLWAISWGTLNFRLPKNDRPKD